jgi:hypothetical protein
MLAILLEQWEKLRTQELVRKLAHVIKEAEKSHNTFICQLQILGCWSHGSVQIQEAWKLQAGVSAGASPGVQSPESLEFWCPRTGEEHIPVPGESPTCPSCFCSILAHHWMSSAYTKSPSSPVTPQSHTPIFFGETLRYPPPHTPKCFNQ